MGILTNNKIDSNLKLKNTCYITSSLEALLNLEEFITDIRSISEKMIKEKKMKIISEFKKLINQRLVNTKSKVDPIEIKNILSEVDKKYKDNEQEDANDFISLLLNEMIKEVKGIGYKKRENQYIPIDEMDKEAYEKIEKRFFNEYNSFLINLFYGKLKKEYFCPQHHKIKVNFQIYNMIEITNNNDKDSIEELLKNYQEEKEVNCEINCEKCGIVDNFFLKTTICYLPYYFIIYLVNPIKNNNNDLEIRVSKFIEDKKENNYIYELISVISYYGNFKRGHYICKYKSSESWFIANDNNISKLSSYNIGKHDVILIFAKKQNE